MNRIRIYFLLLLTVSLSACDKWLDIQPKGKILLTTAEEYGMLFDNITSYNMSDIAYLDDEMWRNASNVASVWNTWNLTAANMLYLPNSDYDRSFNAAGNSGTTGSTFYQNMYERISTICNTIIYEKDKMKGSEAEIKTVVAEAKMLRAFSYFLLVNFYAKPYDVATADKDKAVPLKLDPFVETDPDPAQSTVAEVYAQIEKDINEAIPDLKGEAKSPYRFNQAAAFALKAKVHLYKKEFDACIAAAVESNKLSSTLFDLATLVSATTNKPTKGLYANGSENLFFATVNPQNTYVGPEMIELLDGGLVAYGQNSAVKDARRDLYKRPSATINDYKSIISWVPNTKEYSPNVVGLTNTEVLLMLGECYARKGQNDKVKEVLKPYLESRYRNYVHTDLVLPQDIVPTVKFVIDERRKELSRGINRFLDLRRFNTEEAYQKTCVRLFPMDPVATPSIPQQTYILPPKSSLYILPFPSKAIENDKRLVSNTW